MKSKMITINICLSDIPKEKIRTGSNGKKYLDMLVDTLRQVDDKGNTHSVAVSRTKEERAAKLKQVYLGRGKEYIFQGQSNQQAQAPQTTQPQDLSIADISPIDDLTF